MNAHTLAGLRDSSMTMLIPFLVLTLGCISSAKDDTSAEPGQDVATETASEPDVGPGTTSASDAVMETTPSPDTATGDAVPAGAAENWHTPCPVQEREQRMIKVGDISLNVACRGAGPTVVFLHGFPEFHYSWK